MSMEPGCGIGREYTTRRVSRPEARSPRNRPRCLFAPLQALRAPAPAGIGRGRTVEDTAGWPPAAAIATTYRGTLSCTSGFTGVTITSVEFWCSENPCAATTICPGIGAPICPGLVATFGTGNLSCANVLDPDKIRDFALDDNCGYQISCQHSGITVTCRRWARISYVCSLYPGVTKSVCMRVPGSVTLTCSPSGPGKVADEDGATLTFQELLPEALVPSNCMPPPRALAGQSAASYAGGLIILRELELSGLTPCVPPPPPVPGPPAILPCTGLLTGTVAFGGPPVPFTAPVFCTVQVQFTSMGSGIQFYDTEMLTLDLAGPPLPGGLLWRESPTRNSPGMTTLRPAPGPFWVSSFFDVFTELSFDGGVTWFPATDDGGNPEPVRFLLRRDPTDLAAAPTPETPALLACIPNPFNPTTTIEFDLARAGAVRLWILDARGRSVRTLVQESLPAGRHALAWNGKDDAGNRVPSGVYMYRLVAGDFEATKKMVLLQ